MTKNRRFFIFLFVGPFVGLLALYCLPFVAMKPDEWMNGWILLWTLAASYPVALFFGAVPAYLVYFFDDSTKESLPLRWRAPLSFVAGWFTMWLLFLLLGLPLAALGGFFGAIAGLVCSLLAALVERATRAENETTKRLESETS